MKAKAAEEVGISLNHITLPDTSTVEEVISVVKKLNDDDTVSGILVQLPLGPHVGPIGERAVTEAVSPEKDVDGLVGLSICDQAFYLTSLSPRFHAYNIGHLSSRASDPLFAPCTPAGVMRLLDSTGVSIQGLRAVVLGRSDIVGTPVAAMLRNRDATVTQCHSKTKNLPEIVRLPLAPLNRSLTTSQVKEADILVAAIGKAEFVQGSWIKPGAVVIDVGTNYIPGAFVYTPGPSKLIACRSN